MDPIVLEQGDHIYLLTKPQLFDPTADEISEYAFAEKFREKAPNPHLIWFRGQYVEADTANKNGQMWTANELSIKSLTPVFCPVTVMHDPRTAVGLIADSRLLTPDADEVPRSKIDTILALWGHRFPDVVEEAIHNHSQGSLMQSMECFAPTYDCGVCGQTFHRLPAGAEQSDWCVHLRGESGAAAPRILGAVTFTGTGLIFGTRGATGANPNAHLEVEEVAEAHRKWHADSSQKSRRKHRMETVEIAKTEHDRLLKIETAHEEAQTKVGDLEKTVEKVEAEKVKAEAELKEAKTKLTEAEEKSRAEDLRKERIEALGAGFTAKLGETTKQRLTEQAGKFTDEEWAARLEELEELLGVKRDEGGKEEDKGGGKDDFSREETARSHLSGGASPESGDEPSAAERRAVVGGLFPSAVKKD